MCWMVIVAPNHELWLKPTHKNIFKNTFSREGWLRMFVILFIFSLINKIVLGANLWKPLQPLYTDITNNTKPPPKPPPTPSLISSSHRSKSSMWKYPLKCGSLFVEYHSYQVPVHCSFWTTGQQHVRRVVSCLFLHCQVRMVLQQCHKHSNSL